MVEPTAFTIPMVGAPRRFASRRAASVSAVSPDWLMASTSVRLIHQGTLVAELRGVLHFHRNPGQLLQHVLAQKGRVPGGSAGGDDDPLDPQELQVRDGDPARAWPIPPPSRSRPRRTSRSEVGLLEDLLEHEVLEATLLDGSEVPGHLAGWARLTAPLSRWKVQWPLPFSTATSPSSR